MYCVIQEVRRKKPDPYGEHKEIIPYPLEMSINGVEQVPKWCWKWSEERYARPHLEAYKITLHQSYREGGMVKKRQYSVCTMSYYDICESWWGNFSIGGENALAEKIGIGAAELCEIIDTKLEPLRERLEAEFHQSAEYIARQEHRRVLDANNKARSAFSERYGVDPDEYDYCYNVFGELMDETYFLNVNPVYHIRREMKRGFSRVYELHHRLQRVSISKIGGQKTKIGQREKTPLVAPVKPCVPLSGAEWHPSTRCCRSLRVSLIWADCSKITLRQNAGRWAEAG